MTIYSCIHLCCLRWIRIFVSKSWPHAGKRNIHAINTKFNTYSCKFYENHWIGAFEIDIALNGSWKPYNRAGNITKFKCSFLSNHKLHWNILWYRCSSGYSLYLMFLYSDLTINIFLTSLREWPWIFMYENNMI